jgi:hypothetical protein
MITRPLELATRLRPPPRNFDYLFWVNGVLIALFFVFFGSRFVLSPGLGVTRAEDILPPIQGSVAGAVPTQLTVNVMEGGLIYVDTGFVTLEQLKQWLAAEAKRTPGGTLLVHLHRNNSAEKLSLISSAAYEAGFKVQISGVEAGRPQGEHGTEP